MYLVPLLQGQPASTQKNATFCVLSQIIARTMCGLPTSSRPGWGRTLWTDEA